MRKISPVAPLFGCVLLLEACSPAPTGAGSTGPGSDASQDAQGAAAADSSASNQGDTATPTDSVAAAPDGAAISSDAAAEADASAATASDGNGASDARSSSDASGANDASSANDASLLVEAGPPPPFDETLRLRAQAAMVPLASWYDTGTGLWNT